MKILIDMNLSPKWTAALESHGIEAVYWADIGAESATDDEIVEYARAHDFTIFTHDLDFSAIIAVSRSNRPSVIQLRTGVNSAESAIPLVMSALREWAAEIEAGAILTIELNKARVRILPFR